MDKTGKNIQRLIFPIYPERSPHLHAMMINCGSQTVKPGETYCWNGMERGSREFVIWQYTCAGMGMLDFCGEKYPQFPGDGMLLLVPEDHCYYIPKDSPFWQFEFLTMNGSEAIRLAREFRRRHGPVIRLPETAGPVALLHDALRKKGPDFFQDRFRTSAFAYGFLMELLASDGTSSRNRSTELVPLISEFCRKNMDRMPDVAELAAIAGCSRWHFTRRFMAEEGMPPHRYLLRMKMQLAVRLLQTTHGPIKSIAAQCGFEDASYFCKVFRSIYNSTPAEFRKAARRLSPKDE